MPRKLDSIIGLAILTLPLALTASLDDSTGKIWAVLVAGSNEYDNYRHQADVCHAYQIFRRHGVPDSQIIVMMYDDIAQNPANPIKGQIFNKPGGPDVYVNVPKDYTGDAVTPQNFIHVLTGNSSALEGVGSGKVLKSGPNDHVFVNFVDHGATGLIGFPSDLMYADDLSKTLLAMHNKHMYKKLVFYLEACESGSMFDKFLPTNISVFATTAANPNQPSSPCYWNNTLHTHLGDEYSISWMEDIDYAEHHVNLTTKTLLQQYRNVVTRVKESQPCMYGEIDIENDHVIDFMGNSDNQTVAPVLKQNSHHLDPFKDSVSSRDVPLAILNNKLLLAKDLREQVKLQRNRRILLEKRDMVDQLFDGILHKVALQTNSDKTQLLQSRTPLTPDMMPCYRTLVDNFSKTCLNINKNTYTLGHLYKLANLCALQDLQVQDVLQVYAEECTETFPDLSGVE